MITPPNEIIFCDLPLGNYESTIGQLFTDRAKKFKNRALLLERAPEAKEFLSFSWNEIFQETQKLGENLLQRGVKKGDRIAILSPNRREMFVSVMAIYSIGAISVPIFSGYFPDQVNYILDHSGSRFLFTSDFAQIQKVASSKKLPVLEKIFVFDYDVNLKDQRAQPFQELIAPISAGEIWSDRLREVKPDDTCVIMYTSGTTGKPKGVELGHRNLISQQKGISLFWKLTDQDRLLSYLPWHHCFGGNFETFMAIYHGIPMAIDASKGKDLDLLIDNWKFIKPTIYFSVPAVFQALVRAIDKNPKLEKVIFHPELRFVFTAAAPLPPDIYQVFIERGIPVHEGWGLTESSPDITLTQPERKHSPGIVGTPIPGVEIKINEEGEILARGPNIMKGYYRNPEASKKVLEKDGWLHTGDLGEWTQEGLRIVGRADGVFKLVNGEKVPSSLVEGALISGSKFIDRAVVTGRGKNFVTAILFCNEEVLGKWALEKGIHFSSFSNLVKKNEVRALILEDVQKVNQTLVPKYYQIKRFYLAPRSCTLEKGELTPTAKTCRNKVMQNYSEAIANMYNDVKDSKKNPREIPLYVSA